MSATEEAIIIVIVGACIAIIFGYAFWGLFTGGI